MQVIVAGSGEDWKAARKMPASPYHILSPLGFEVQLKKSLLPNDTNLPRYVVCRCPLLCFIVCVLIKVLLYLTVITFIHGRPVEHACVTTFVLN